MQYIVEWIRKLVLLVLLMEVVLQLQAGKQYEAYIKMLVGIMVIYSLVSGIFVFLGNLEQIKLEPMQEFQWTENLFSELEKSVKEPFKDSMEEKDFERNKHMKVNVEIPQVSEINIPVFYVDCFRE